MKRDPQYMRVSKQLTLKLESFTSLEPCLLYGTSVGAQLPGPQPTLAVGFVRVPAVPTV